MTTMTTETTISDSDLDSIRNSCYVSMHNIKLKLCAKRIFCRHGVVLDGFYGKNLNWTWNSPFMENSIKNFYFFLTSSLIYISSLFTWMCAVIRWWTWLIIGGPNLIIQNVMLLSLDDPKTWRTGGSKWPLWWSKNMMWRRGGSNWPFFLGLRGPYGIPLSACLRRKIWITHIQAYMPHESSEDSSNQADGPKGSPKCPPWSLGIPRPPHRPPMHYVLRAGLE